MCVKKMKVITVILSCMRTKYYVIFKYHDGLSILVKLD